MHADVKVTGIHRLPVVIDVANKSRMANGGAPAGFLEAEERKKTERYCEVYWKGGELFTPFVTGAHSEEGSMLGARESLGQQTVRGPGSSGGKRSPSNQDFLSVHHSRADLEECAAVFLQT